MQHQNTKNIVKPNKTHKKMKTKEELKRIENYVGKMLVEVLKEVYPFAEEYKPFITYYDKDRYCLTNDRICIANNYDKYGRIDIYSNDMIAKGFANGVEKWASVKTIKEGIIELVKFYHNIK